MAGRIGVGGIAAIVAVALAVGAIGYRIQSEPQVGSVAAEAPADAINDLEQRAKDTPNDPAAWQQLGFARFDRGHFE